MNMNSILRRINFIVIFVRVRIIRQVKFDFEKGTVNDQIKIMRIRVPSASQKIDGTKVFGTMAEHKTWQTMR